MAKSICDVNSNDSWLPLGIKYKSACNIEKKSGEKNSNIPIFSPEGLEGAKEYAKGNFPGCTAVSGSKLDSLFNLYNVDCSNKPNE